MSSPEPLSDSDLDFGPTLRGLREGLKVFGRYELVRMLGRGGMGVVWLARDTKLDLPMALKFLPENLVHDEVALDDLRRETRRCLKLTHQNIVHVFDLVDDEATAAIAMEYVEGRTLSAMRLEKPNRVFEPADILPWLQQVCEALEYAHTKAKIVHHDLKPGNLMLSSEGEVKVMDFGIASSIGDSMSRVSKAAKSSSGGGTLPYMSPQQLMGFPPSVSDDVYALGATIYELLTGKPPFFRGSLESQIQSVMPPSMTERRQELKVTGAEVVPEKWERMVAACLQKDLAMRPKSMQEAWTWIGGPLPQAQAAQPHETSAPKSPPPSNGPGTPEPAVSDVTNTMIRGLTTLGLIGGIVAAWSGLQSPPKDKPIQKREPTTNYAEGAKSDSAQEAARQTAEKRAAGIRRHLLGSAPSATQARKDLPFVNTLGMSFVPVKITGGMSDGQMVLFSIWETRVQDYDVFAKARNITPIQSVFLEQKDELPVIYVSWEEAKSFCEWLTVNERGAGRLPAGYVYRLPSDHEWSCAIGAGGRERSAELPEAKSGKSPGYPWGPAAPPPQGFGNFDPNLAVDNFSYTSPVGSFAADSHGLHDLSGNVWEWCGDWNDATKEHRVMRGGSWHLDMDVRLQSTYRRGGTPNSREDNVGFRCVIAPAGSY